MIKREVIPLKQHPDFILALPGSKSITNRAFLCAALAKGKSRLYGTLESGDTYVMTRALKKLGVQFKRIKDTVEITGCGQKFEKKGKVTLDLHNAGTATRFLTAIMAVREGETVITGDKRMQERPMADLIDGLEQLGVSIEYLNRKGCPPIKIGNSKLKTLNSKQAQNLKSKVQNYVVKMKGDKSSQYFSALLMLGPLLDKPLRIEVVGDLVSKPYIDITIAVMKVFGVKVKNNKYQSFIIKPQKYKAADYHIEGDASAASYWISMAYLHDGKVSFSNLQTPSLNKKFVHKGKTASASLKGKKLNKKSIQGDASYGKILKSIGKGEINMNSMPDSAMTLAITASFKKEVTKITGLSTLRIKETDRLAALEKELKKVGVRVKTTKDSITVEGPIEDPIDGISDKQSIGPSIGSSICTYNDHRMAMCFAVVGTMVPGIVIENPGCTDKTYPQFWNDLERAYLSPIKLGQKNLVLTGMRCSGKTRNGKKIAKLLGRKFVDLDDEIIKDQCMSIPETVKKHGWPYFRKVEQKMCSKYANAKNLVIATGGGVILNPKNMKALKINGVNVFLFADPNEIIRRITKQAGTRPSLTGKKPEKEIYDVWHKRRDLYLKYADFVWDNTSGKVLGENLDRIFK